MESCNKEVKALLFFFVVSFLDEELNIQNLLIVQWLFYIKIFEI